MSPAAKQLDKDLAAIRLRDFYGMSPLEPVPTIYTMTDYGRGERDYVRVFVVCRGAIEEVTYWTARLLSYARTDRGIAMGGAGYSKALEVADALVRTLYGHPINQSNNWRQL